MCKPIKFNKISTFPVAAFKKLFQHRFNELDICWDDYSLSVFETDSGDPLSCNFKSKLVFYSPKITTELELIDYEVLALFAHEIGHLVDKTEVNEDGTVKPSPKREYNADAFAVELGLGYYLFSALEKIRKRYSIYPENRQEKIEIAMSKSNS